MCGFLASIPFPLDLAAHDTIAWAPSNDGNFYIQFSFSAFAGHLSLQCDPLFLLI